MSRPQLIVASIAALLFWDVPRAPAVQHRPLRRRIPTLILTGEYDGVVSPDEGERIAASLRRAVLHQVPGAGPRGPHRNLRQRDRVPVLR